MCAYASWCLAALLVVCWPLRAQAPAVPAAQKAPTQSPAATPSRQASATDPAYAFLDRGYRSLETHDLEEAAASFEQALQVAPDRVHVRKELAYAYLKMGETGQAIRQFEAIQRLAPGDYENILSLAFLYFETRREDRALELFEFAAQAADPAIQARARTQLSSIRREYQAQIERWQRAADQDPENASARLELAALCRKNREYRRAITHYQTVRRLMPGDVGVLVELARLYEAANDPAAARAFYLLAWRSADPRTSEQGRAGLANTYPPAADFERALEYDPRNTKVRLDLAYLYLNLQQQDAAAGEFEKIIAQQPEDWQTVLQLALLYAGKGQGDKARPLLERVMKRGNPEQARKATEALLRLKGVRAGQTPPSAETPEIASLRQMARGYAALGANNLPAAAEFFESAYQLAPDDLAALRLGWIYNVRHEDAVAVRWFRRATSGADARIAAEADRAVRNLEPNLRAITHSFWANPVISSRWQDLFGYAQWKAELKSKRSPIRPYLSLRFNGDLRTRSEAAAPLFYSDGGWTLGVGLFAMPRKDLYAWGEAGNTLSYYARPVPGTGRFYPDYRGGVTWFRTWGPSLFTDLPGYRRFVDVAVANIFISRYSNDLFEYVQTRAGYHLPRRGMVNSLAYASVNYVRDARGLYWANFLEFGPGLTFGFRNFPQMQASIGLLRGVYTQNLYNPRRPNFLDLRINVWYSRSY